MYTRMHKYNKEVLRLKPERSATELECSLSNRKNGYRIVTKMLFSRNSLKIAFYPISNKLFQSHFLRNA